MSDTVLNGNHPTSTLQRHFALFTAAFALFPSTSVVHIWYTFVFTFGRQLTRQVFNIRYGIQLCCVLKSVATQTISPIFKTVSTVSSGICVHKTANRMCMFNQRWSNRANTARILGKRRGMLGISAFSYVYGSV